MHVTILIVSHNRPIYLWTCLDSIYRTTRHPHRAILLDMASDDRLIPDVIVGFERRGLFAEVIRCPVNDPLVLPKLVTRNLDNWSPYFAYIEGDVAIEPSACCWLTEMVEIMDSNPKLAMLGSAIDRQDFILPAEAEVLRGQRDPKTLQKIIKASSVERFQDVASAGDARLFRPHTPAGRFLMLRTEALRRVGMARDSSLAAKCAQHGYETAIATRVRHRHLSLLHLYDLPDYDVIARDRHVAALTKDVERESLNWAAESGPSAPDQAQ